MTRAPPRASLPLLALVGCAPPEVHETLPLATEIAAKAEARWAPEDLAFDWIPTVLGFGMHRLHVATSEERWQAHYRAWLERAPASPVFHSSDSMSPAVLAATLMIEDPSADLSRVTDAADSYLAGAPRTGSGAIEHWAEGSFLGEIGQVWVDSMFMFGLYLLRAHERGDPDALDAFVEQYRLFSTLCRDPDDQLYRHAWDDVAGQNIPSEAVYWARGNAWVLVAGAEALAIADLPAVRPLFEAHLTAILGAQGEDGLWRTVLNVDDPANYAETSASALIGTAIARAHRAGAAGDEVLPALDRAVTGVRGRIDDDPGGPVVEGTSFGTNPGDLDYYLSVGTADDLMLGVGSVLAFLAEVDGLPRP